MIIFLDLVSIFNEFISILYTNLRIQSSFSGF